MSPVRGIPVAPLTGAMDLRSTADLLPGGSLRLRQNLETVGEGKLRRGTGLEKLLNKSNYNNQDFHDQLLIFTPGGLTQPVTMLFEAESSRKVRSLFAATQGKIAKLNEHSGNWRILGSGYGGIQSLSAAAPRFRAAAVGDYLAFTNGYDKPMYHRLETTPVDTDTSLLKTFDDLDLIGLSAASVVWSWRNCLFFADVVMDQERFRYRIVWSNFNDPTSFDPAVLGSITGTKDLNVNETILAGRPTANPFLIYTTMGIWEMAAVGGEASFAFARRYNGEDNMGAAVLKYPNTLCGLPDAHLYGAEDGLYVFSPYYAKPERLEWLHRSTPALGYNQKGEESPWGAVDDLNCQVHVALATKTQAWFSYARVGALNQCPDITLRINLQYRTCDVVDYGFTALVPYRSYDVGTVRDFIIENRICTLEALTAAGYPYDKEGLPNPLPGPTAPFTPTVFFTHETQVVGTGETPGPAKVPTLVERTAGVATITVPGHGYTTGNKVEITGMSDPSFDTPGSIITVLNANQFTYSSRGPDVASEAASSPTLQKLGTKVEAIAMVASAGTVTVKSEAHGFSTGQHLTVAGKAGGNDRLNVEDVAITVADVDTFTYPLASALVSDTQVPRAGIQNLVDGKFYPPDSPKLTVPTDFALTAKHQYWYQPKANEDHLTLLGPPSTLTADTLFTYDGMGAVLVARGQVGIVKGVIVGQTYQIATQHDADTADEFTSVGASSNAVGTIFVATGTTLSPPWEHGSSLYWIEQNNLRLYHNSDFPLVVGQAYRIANYGAGDDFTNVGAISNANDECFVATGVTPTTWTHGTVLIAYTETVIPVTAVLSSGLTVVYQTVGAVQIPTSVKRDDPDNPDQVTMTLTAHGLAVGDIVRIEGISDPTFNGIFSVLTVVDADHFIYVREGPVTPATPTSNPVVRLLTTEDIITEDWNGTQAADSLCALLGDAKATDPCPTCEGETLIVAASSSDLTLKQLGKVFYRERFASVSQAGVSTDVGYQSSIAAYLLDPIESILRFAPVFAPWTAAGQPIVEISKFVLGVLSVIQDSPLKIFLRMGRGSQIADPNIPTDNRIVWQRFSGKELRNLSLKSQAQHEGAHTTPSRITEWWIYSEARILYPELSVNGVGGDFEMSNAIAETKIKEATKY